MSKYTTEVRYICETEAGYTESVGYDNVSEVISKSMAKVFSFTYPIYDEEYRSVLQTKILKHYYTREIGAETYGLWKLWLDTRMNEIMPYYNKMYESAMMEFNPLYDVDITRTHEGNSVNNGVSDNTSENVERYADTPQGGLSDLRQDRYLTTATITNNDTKNSSTIDTTDQYIERVVGKQGAGNYSSMIKQYRDVLINIDMMIIDELQDLFLNLW